MPREAKPCAYPGCNEQKKRHPMTGHTMGSYCEYHTQLYDATRHELETDYAQRSQSNEDVERWMDEDAPFTKAEWQVKYLENSDTDQETPQFVCEWCRATGSIFVGQKRNHRRRKRYIRRTCPYCKGEGFIGSQLPDFTGLHSNWNIEPDLNEDMRGEFLGGWNEVDWVYESKRKKFWTNRKLS